MQFDEFAALLLGFCPGQGRNRLVWPLPPAVIGQTVLLDRAIEELARFDQARHDLRRCVPEVHMICVVAYQVSISTVR